MMLKNKFVHIIPLHMTCQNVTPHLVQPLPKCGKIEYELGNQVDLHSYPAYTICLVGPLILVSMKETDVYLACISLEV